MKRAFQTLALATALLAAPFAHATTPGTVEPQKPASVEAANSFSVNARLTASRDVLRFHVQKNTPAPIRIEMKNAEGEVLFTSTLGKQCTGKAYALKVADLPDGQYTIEVSNRDKKDVKTVELKTPAPVRQVALN
jgi:hypothetical protein